MGRRLPASPTSRPARTAASAPNDPFCVDADGIPLCGRSSPPDGIDGSTTGPGRAGGSTGTSRVSVLPSASSLVPAVIAARVGTEASPTSRATNSTYRRVGPEKPESA
ncbi:hypothetical protein [Paractinoplanes durhamensis]|uniref:hypothetical protein n=1 Tax=Paractinoplanes durhamensis TaxID=113563 RepID=UPI00362B7928